MPHILDTQLYLDTVCELLEQGQTHVTVPVSGGSMLPFLHSGDTVCVDLLDTPPKRGDILLYRRECGRYILHRLYKARKDGSFLMIGDAQQELEVLPHKELLCARVTSVHHKGKRYSPHSPRWLFYRYIWLNLIPLRHRLMSLRHPKK